MFPRVLQISGLIFLLEASLAAQSTIVVPVDFSTVQQAIDAALDGDTVLVEPGTYSENIDFRGKAITVTSSGGAAVTTIDGRGVNSVVTFRTGETRSAVLDGFRLTNGFGAPTGYPYPGGAVTCHNASSPTIQNNIMEGNLADGGGGVSCDGSSAPLILKNTIRNNQARNGGGIMCHGAANPTIQDCVITNNLATNPGWGGGIQCALASATVVNTVIAFNTSGWEGGGIQHGDGAAVLVVNSLIFGNTAPSGGGIFAWISTLTLWNTIVRQNSPAQIIVSSASVSTSYCDIENGWAGPGNFDADPLFADPASLDFHLTSGSPCIDTGSNAAPGLLTLDFEGDPRVLNGTVDIGPDEHTSVPVVFAVSPARGPLDESIPVTITGASFSQAGSTNVMFGSMQAGNIVVVDAQTITCNAPASSVPGPTDVTVQTDLGVGNLPGGFTYTPALLVEGNHVVGGDVELRHLCDPGDRLIGIWGLPPAVEVQTPPYGGALCITPLHILFILPSWPFDEVSLGSAIPDDPPLSGVQLLFQALIGPALTGPVIDGAWTNCGVLTIQ